MNPQYSGSHRLAIAAGAAATGGALAILLADPLMTGNWKLDHGLLPIIVGITIAAGHLVGSAVRGRRPLSALGFAAIFVVGTALTIYSSVGSQTESLGNKASNAEAHNAAIAEKRAAIKRAGDMLALSEAMP